MLAPPTTVPTSPHERAKFIRSQIPSKGLFQEKEWLTAPNAFELSAPHLKLIQRLGDVLHKFNLACNLLYRQSVEGKQPTWIAELLDRGKPESLINHARHGKIKSHVPAVIRPDLILTEEGFALVEIDSVPGGIGLTQWLNQFYSDLNEPIVGDANGMKDGFRHIFPEGDVVISEEASSYRPEMEFLVGEEQVHAAETYHFNGTPVYRFFENFDWPNLPTIRESYQPGVPLTPPLKPQLEEKLWLALFWNGNLQEFWRQNVGEKGVRLLQQVIPYSWVLDPTPLPPHGVIPRLEISDWNQLKSFGQKRRDFIIKKSGFHEDAWGSRSVKLGSDLSTPEWHATVDKALAEFDLHPHIMQEFKKGAQVRQEYLDFDDQLKVMQGRARVCPYYFAKEDNVQLGGILVTLCPADKKLIHGMRDAVISPAKISASS